MGISTANSKQRTAWKYNKNIMVFDIGSGLFYYV